MTVVLALSDLKYNESVFLAGKKVDIQDQKIVDHLIEIGAVEDASVEETVEQDPNTPPVEG